MASPRSLRNAEFWWLVAVALGVGALLALVGIPFGLGWPGVVAAIALSAAMYTVIYSKLQFTESFETGDVTPPSSSVESVLRTVLPGVRLRKEGGDTLSFVPRADALHELRVVRSPRAIRVTSTPPARGELAASRLRARFHEWEEAVTALRNAFGTPR